MNGQDSQYRVQPRSISHEVHQHIAVNIDIKCTNISIKIEFNDNTLEEKPKHRRDIGKNTQMKYNQQFGCIK